MRSHSPRRRLTIAFAGLGLAATFSVGAWVNAHAGTLPALRSSRTRPRQDAAEDSASVAAMVERFHAALAAADSAGALALLAPDAVVLEGGAVEGRAEYRAHHLGADVAFARAVPSARGSIRVHVQGDAAWALSTSTAVGTYRGRAIDVAGAELMVLTRGAPGWQVRAVHWSSRTRRGAGR